MIPTIPVPSKCVYQTIDHSVYHICSGVILPQELGQWLIEHNLYAVGNDFTSERAQEDPQYQGRSTLKRLWENTQLCDGVNNQLNIFVIATDNDICGVVVWLKPSNTSDGHQNMDEVRNNILHKPRKSIAVCHLGQLMAYVKPQYRQKGWIKGVFSHLNTCFTNLAQQAHTVGKMPIICGQDACAHILKATTQLPVVTDLNMCLRLRQDIWSIWTSSLLEKKSNINQKWIVPPHLLRIPRPKKEVKVKKIR